ncbi:MAG: hypothetical protein IPH20_08015 [Bacteroidales bacterium]|nr:hypothetical protein [Bacteroidales bacterium]
MKKSEEIFQQKTDYKDLVFKIWRYKVWFIASTSVFLVAAYLFIKLSTVVYTNQTTLLLKESERNNFLSSQDMMQGFGLFGSNQNIENELGVLSSYTLINDAVSQLNLETSFYREDYIFGQKLSFKFLKTIEETYSDKILQVSINKAELQPIDLPIYFTILNNNEIKIEAYGTDVPIYDYIEDNIVTFADVINIKGNYKFGEEIKGKYFNFRVHLINNGEEIRPSKEKRYFSFNSLSYLTLNYQAAIAATVTSRTSSLVIITMNGDNKYKISDFLNTLTNSYLERNLEKKEPNSYKYCKIY